MSFLSRIKAAVAKVAPIRDERNKLRAENKDLKVRIADCEQVAEARGKAIEGALAEQDKAQAALVELQAKHDSLSEDFEAAVAAIEEATRVAPENAPAEDPPAGG